MLSAGCTKHTTETSLLFPIGTNSVALSGTVSDAVTRLPLAGVQISASSIGGRTTTGANGAYLLSVEVHGLLAQLDVIAEMPGYCPRRVTVSTSQTRLDIELQPHLEGRAC